MNSYTHAQPADSRGFTLIEVMIAVVIIGILAAIALPAYQEYVRQSRRADGQAALMALQLAQEKFRANNTTYASSTATVGVASTSPEGHYKIRDPLENVSAVGYRASADPQGVQASDTSCDPLTMTLSGGTITYGPAGCWKR
jgi:type IV pilus assembly protein PilE